MKVISIECKDCMGTGLYVGLAERDGAAVVCHSCKGTGMTDFRFNEFTGRKDKPNVKRVYQTNPGIVIGTGHGHSLSSFGGMPATDWADGKPFPPGSENRTFTCPAWWYQCADYDKKPKWDECMSNLGGSFSGCKHFCDKAKCWERFDKENKT